MKEQSLYKILNRSLDSLVRPEAHLLRRAWPAFQLCGLMGAALGVLLAVSLALSRGLSLPVMMGIALSAVVTFFALMLATKIIIGQERIIYYHHEIAVIAVAAILLGLLRQPILAYLDVTILGIGTFLVCGRIGCLMVGCCHGRPWGWGICYGAEHASAGFTPYFVGVRLFPVQAIESLWVFGVMLAGVALILRGTPPGTALAWYVVTYDLGRFCFEFMRGDPDRSYLWGFSQPQWISLLLMCGVVSAEITGALPFHLWHAGATVGLALAMIAIGLRRRFQPTAKHQLLHPRHVKQVAEAIAMAPRSSAETTATGQWTIMPRRNSAPARVNMACTSLGIRISAGKTPGAAGDTYHYAFSSQDRDMTEETARILAQLVLQLKRSTDSGEFMKGNQDVFHLLIHPSAGKELVNR